MMSWKNMRAIGPGLENFGNTCFLNSVLQVLTYTPPLANYLLSQEHTRQCMCGLGAFVGKGTGTPLFCLHFALWYCIICGYCCPLPRPPQNACSPGSTPGNVCVGSGLRLFEKRLFLSILLQLS